VAYEVEGRILEVCTCKILCPCWVGEDPDFGTCDAALAYHVDNGVIEGVDVSGLTVAMSAHLPGNVFAGDWKVVMYADDKATPEQAEALQKCFSGQLGGPPEQFAALIGEVVAVHQVPIRFDVAGGKGVLEIGDVVHAELEPFEGPAGQPTTLVESAFSTIPGSPAFVGKASTYKNSTPELGFNVDIEGFNAIQGNFRFEAA
jgi:hypothetical protein